MSIQNLLSEEEVSEILSMNRYWEEVVNRNDASPLIHEMQQVCNRLGLKILWVLADYAKAQKANEDK